MLKATKYLLCALLTFATCSYAQVEVTATGTIVNDDSPGSTTIFNCGAGGNAFAISTGASSTPCVVGGFAFGAQRPNGFNVTGAGYSVSAGSVFLGDSGNGGHIGLGMIYDTPVDIRKFTATFTFVPNGKNLVFTAQNATNNMFGFNGRNFSAGAGCEAGFYQAFDADTPNNIFGMEMTQDIPTRVADGITFTYSNAMIYSYRVSPCIPPFTPSWTNPSPAQTVPDKISTFPVPMNSPASTAYATNNHTFSVTLNYSNLTGNFTMDMYDVTAGGSCPGANCFSHTWTGVNIPSLVGANTAYVGLNMGCNLDCPQTNQIKSFRYVVN